VAHGGGEGGQLGLHVDAGAVPTQEGMERVGMALIPRAG